MSQFGPKLKIKTLLIPFVLSLFVCDKSFAKDLCISTDSEQWQLSERAVSKKNTVKAVNDLKILISEFENEEVYFAKKYGNTLECQIANATKIIKLYSLKLDALKSRGSEYSERASQRFCTALQLSTLCH